MEEERVTSQGSKRTLPAEEPAVDVPPLPPRGDDTLDPTSFDDYAILGQAAPDGGNEEDSVLGAYDHLISDDEDREAYDDMDDGGGGSGSDSELEENENRVRFWDGDAAGSTADLVAGPLLFLGRLTRFASFQGAAGFMRLYAAQADPNQDHEAGMIVVHYRLTRFSRLRSGGHGVEMRDFGTGLHHLRYHVPFPAAAVNPVSSLRLVGASLAAEVYPYRSYLQLQALWSGLVAELPVCVPPPATRLVVTVDVGVLRSEDRTPERMRCMRAALAVLARENDASPMTCGLEQHLPAPVCCDDKSSDEVDRPAKRSRFAVAGEVCAICYEVLEHGLAAWPRCSHVFHGKCLEQLLVTVQHRCPMCRSSLSINGIDSLFC